LRHASNLLKLAASAALFGFACSRVNFADLTARVTIAQLALALAAAISLYSIQAYVIALRFRLCLRMLEHEISPLSAWVTSQYAGFFSHTPISFLGGDAMRIWHLAKTGVPLIDGTKAVLLDRAIGFIGMLAIALSSAPALLDATKDDGLRYAVLAALAAGGLGCLAFLILGRISLAAPKHRALARIVELATASRYLLQRPRLAAGAVAFAFVITAINIVCAWAVGKCISTELSLSDAFAAAPMAFLITMIPVSIAGWGLREGAFVVLFGVMGVPDVVSLTVSVTLGVAFLLAYLPAPVLLLLARRGAPLT
jgi:uncharacterized membrane protein YbhN (UPF0104 family)